MTNTTEKLNQSQKILNAAFKCISERGYSNVSLRDIADEAGVVLSQLNYYYKNKEGLFTEIVKTLMKQYINEIEDNLKKSNSRSERINCIIEYFQEMLRTKPELFKLLFDLTSMALWSPSLQEHLNDLFSNLAGLIDKYIMNDLSYDEKTNYRPSLALSRLMLGTLFGTSIQIILANGEEDMVNSLATLKILFE